MKRLVTSDWQLCDGARDRYRTDFVVKTLPKLIEKYKPDQFLILGDITEHKDQHPAPLVNEIVEFFSYISTKTDVIVLQGNHDFLHNAHPFFKFLTFLDARKGIQWISTPTVLDNCLYLPHTRDYKKDWQGIDFKGHDFIFAHNIFTGVSTQTGHALSGISPSIFPNDAFVISGDVHEPQSFGCVTYVGSPCLCDFGDNYQPRVLLLDGLKAKSIKVYGPQKRLIEVDWNGDNSTFHYNILNADDIVKLRVNLKMEHVPEWDKIRAYLYKWADEKAVLVNTIQPVVAYEVGERAKLVKGSKKNDAEYLTSFVKRSGIDERTAQVGRDIIDLV